MAGRRGAVKKEKEVIDWEAVARLDEDCKGLRAFRLKDKLKDAALEEAREEMVVSLAGRELTVEYLQTSGFSRPVLVARRDDLGLKLPHREFTIDGIRSAVGSRRQVEVLDTRTQKTKTMCMREWCRYWEQEPREDILNGISLEFSGTRLDAQVTAPRVVRQVDWIDKAWPRHLKELQEEATNNLKDMMYPKVQKFVIMSTANSFIDFHVDFGGTSVWYHVLRGNKVFWLVPPTDANLLRYEKWQQAESDKKTEFFGSLVDSCCRLEVPAGATLFLPAGWIHAVFTPRDSVVFSGSFLHSFNIEHQLKVSFIEESLGVAEKHRFPFFTEMLWYVLDRYVACLTGRSHVDLPEEEKRRMKLEKGENIDPNKEFVNPGLSEEIPAAPLEHVHLTAEELRGIKYIVMFLQQLPDEAKEVPVLIPDPAALVRAVREVVGQHAGDCPRRAVTGSYVLRWTEDDDVDEDSKSRKIIPKPSDYTGAGAENPFHQKYLRAMAGRADGTRRGQEAPRKRRARCQTCAGCAGSDCQECAPCRDMPKHGGPGRVKQSCVKRRCARPTLPLAAACSACGLDGWGGQPDPRRLVEDGRPSTLLECLLCWDVRHKECGEEGGTVLTRLSNSWECPACSTGGVSMDTS